MCTKSRTLVLSHLYRGLAERVLFFDPERISLSLNLNYEAWGGDSSKLTWDLEHLIYSSVSLMYRGDIVSVW